MELYNQIRVLRGKKMGELSPNDVVVYYELLMINNAKNWDEWFPTTIDYLKTCTGLSSKDTVARAINHLEQYGYIRIKRGKNKQPNQYSIIELYAEKKNRSITEEEQKYNTDGIKTEHKPNTSRTEAEQKQNRSRTEAEQKQGSYIRQDKTRQDNNNPDFLTNSRELTPAEEQVKSAFESTFHPLTKMGELDMLKAYTGDYGAKAVLRAIEAASKSKRETWDRHRLSPTYLLPILQTADEQRQKPVTQEQPVNPLWIPRKKTPEELEGEKKRLAWLKEQERKHGIN